LTVRRIRFTATAQEHVRSEKLWWIEHGSHPTIFADELDQALRVVSILPGAGNPYEEAGIVGLRRVFLRKSACHVYYTHDDLEVIVRAVWGAKRERGPLFLG
jgi:plasmid stabilization system protein ParE